MKMIGHLQTVGWAVLATAVLLGVKALSGDTLGVGIMWRIFAVMLLYMLSLQCYSAWLARQQRYDFAGWKRVAGKGKLYFLLRYGIPARGWTLGLVMVGLRWADGGKLFSNDLLLLGLLIWSGAGAVLASSDWQRLQRSYLATTKI